MFDWASNRNRNRRRILDDVDALGRHLAFPWRCAFIRVKYAEHYVLKCAYSCVNEISFTRAMAKTKVCMDASWQKASVHGCMDADVYAAHHLFPQGRRIDVAVVARLVAMEPNIDLATKMGENSSSSVSGAK